MKNIIFCQKEIQAKIIRMMKIVLKFSWRIILIFVGVVSCVIIIPNWGKEWNAIVALLMIITVIVAVFSIVETNLNSRFCTGADLLIRLEERFTSEEMKRKRKKAIEAIQKGSYKDKNVTAVLDFFSVIAILVHKNVLDTGIVWSIFSAWLIPYYLSLETHIKKIRKKDKKLYETLSKLYYEILYLEARETRKEWEDEDRQKIKLSEFYNEEIKECS